MPEVIDFQIGNRAPLKSRKILTGPAIAGPAAPVNPASPGKAGPGVEDLSRPFITGFG